MRRTISKELLTFACCLFFYALSFAQCETNLVPNYSFENSASPQCNYNIYGASFGVNVDDWHSPTATTPDLMTTGVNPNCWTAIPHSAYVGPACNRNVSVNPRTGNAVAFISTYRTGGTCQNGSWYEYLEVELNSPMYPGISYYAEMWVNLSANSNNAVDQLGFLFSDTLVLSSSCKPLNYSPQIKAATIIDNDSSWTKISGFYTPIDTINYIIIGVFTDAFHSGINIKSLANHGSNCDAAGYVIDDVSICESEAIGFDERMVDPITIFPNPSKGWIHFRGVDASRAEVYDMMGKSVWKGNVKDKLDLTNLSAGIYYLHLLEDSKTLAKKKIVLF